MRGDFILKLKNMILTIFTFAVLLAFAPSVKAAQIPVIKDNVRIYPGAKIFGNVTLNNNSIIGANAVVTKDVEANSTVFGVPANSKPNKNK